MRIGFGLQLKWLQRKGIFVIQNILFYLKLFEINKINFTIFNKRYKVLKQLF